MFFSRCNKVTLDVVIPPPKNAVIHPPSARDPAVRARRVIGEWIDFYNAERPHSALGGKTPPEAYRGDPPADMMDKPLRTLPTYPQAQQRRQEDRSREIPAR